MDVAVFFFQAEDGIRDVAVTGVQTCALPIFTTSSVKMTPRGGARPSTRSSPQIACATSPEASTVAATKSIASRARSRLLTLTFDINPWPGPRNWAMAGGANGDLAPWRGASLRPD